MCAFFRSEELELYSLLIPREGAYKLFSRLGEEDLIHFIDADPSCLPVNRLNYKHTKRCEELLRSIEEISTVLSSFGFTSGTGSANVPDFLRILKLNQSLRKSSEIHYLDDLEQTIPSILSSIRKNVSALEETQKQVTFLNEERYCLTQVKSFLSASSSSTTIRAGRLMGTIFSEDALRFQKMVFRALKGNCMTIIEQMPPQLHIKITNTATASPILRSFFFIIYNASETIPGQSIISSKLSKLCSAFEAMVFRVYDEENQGSGVEQRITDNLTACQKNNQLLKLTYSHLTSMFDNLIQRTDEITQLEQYRLTVLRELGIYQSINLAKNTGAVLKALVWIPKQQEDYVIACLQETHTAKQASAQLHPAPRELFNKYKKEGQIPSRIRSNDFLDVFQEIVSTYGIPRYREINPAFFTIVTFPFLFGVMFGDVGHGILLLALGVYLMVFQKSRCAATASRGPDMLSKCRYLIAMMGFFATFSGLIYGDFLSIPTWFFGSCYDDSKLHKRLSSTCTPVFGLDPSWMLANNSLLFSNSFKMKLSIILGVSHMTLGVLLKGLNCVIQSNFTELFCEFIPQLAFLFSTFGYMSLLIVVKWLTHFTDTSIAPSILTTLLNIPLKQGETPAGFVALLNHQQAIQQILLIIALICVPLMLLLKPTVVYFQTRKASKHKDHSTLIEEDEEGKDEVKEEEEDFSEVIVHQVIESIEFVLGSVSHTASYLRLWALSLAHSQLAKVFFEKTLLPDIENHSVIGITTSFLVFAMISFGVLLCMDVMECFLHTLRLHWVEFQSKFYKADGVKFTSISFERTLQLHQQAD